MDRNNLLGIWRRNFKKFPRGLKADSKETRLTNTESNFLNHRVNSFNWRQFNINRGHFLFIKYFFGYSDEFRVTNLVNCYVVTLIQLLLENDLFKILIELSGVEESSIEEPSQKLLKKLSIYIFNFLPDCSQYIDFLISAATKTDSTSLILKSSSSFIMNKIGIFIFFIKAITFTKNQAKSKTINSTNWKSFLTSTLFMCLQAGQTLTQ